MYHIVIYVKGERYVSTKKFPVFEAALNVVNDINPELERCEIPVHADAIDLDTLEFDEGFDDV